MSTSSQISECSGEIDNFGHFLSFRCHLFCVLNLKFLPHSLQAYFSVLLCLNWWDSRLQMSGFLYGQSGHSWNTPSYSFMCLVRSPLLLKHFLQFGCTQQWVTRLLWLIQCVFKLLSNANFWSHSAHLKCSSLWEYYCLARDEGLLNALEHSSQYKILCFCWWWWASYLLELHTVSHIWHPILRSFLFFFKFKLWVVNVPLELFPTGVLDVVGVDTGGSLPVPVLMDTFFEGASSW